MGALGALSDADWRLQSDVGGMPDSRLLDFIYVARPGHGRRDLRNRSGLLLGVRGVRQLGHYFNLLCAVAVLRMCCDCAHVGDCDVTVP